MRYATRSAVLATVLLATAGCIEHRIKADPIKIEPIQIDVNLKVDRQLDNFFQFEDRVVPPAPAAPAPATPPATAPAPATPPATAPAPAPAPPSSPNPKGA